MECINNPTSSSSSSSKEKKGVRKRSSSNNKGKGGGRGVRLSTDPQSVAARERRHRISDRFKILQSMVPGGTKMDTVSMLEGAIHYVNFLKTQIWLHQELINVVDNHHQQEQQQHSISLLQQNPSSSSVSLQQQQHQSLPQLPLAQCYFQGEEDYNCTFDMPL